MGCFGRKSVTRHVFHDIHTTRRETNADEIIKSATGWQRREITNRRRETHPYTILHNTRHRNTRLKKLWRRQFEYDVSHTKTTADFWWRQRLATASLRWKLANYICCKWGYLHALCKKYRRGKRATQLRRTTARRNTKTRADRVTAKNASKQIVAERDIITRRRGQQQQKATTRKRPRISNDDNN